MNQRPPGSQRTYTPFPYTTPFRSSDAKAPIAALLRDGFPATEPIVADDVRIDDAIRPIELHHVVDADSSQTVVIAEAAGGRSLVVKGPPGTGKSQRSEEHTSELQSLMRISYAVFCLKKKINTHLQ